jgi:hypothetical protein
VKAVRYDPQARAEFLHEVEYHAAISTRLAELCDKAVHTAEMQRRPLLRLGRNADC